MMEPEQERPFGLTLMAALSFGFALFNVGAAAQLGLALKLKLDPSHPPGFDMSIGTALLALPLWFIVYELCASVVKAGLLFTMGLGLWSFKRIAGRMVANVYAVVSLADSVVPLVALPHGVTPQTGIAILFPLFVLLAVNTMWKPILVR